MTNRCTANPNTSPDAPSNGESGEVFGFALHQLVTKFLGVMGDESLLVHFGIICIQNVDEFGVICSKGFVSFLVQHEDRNTFTLGYTSYQLY